MFERFTSEARAVVTTAQEEARGLRQQPVGTEHVLLAMLNQPESLPARVLDRHGVTHGRVIQLINAARRVTQGDDLDAEALRSIGIDLSVVRERVDDAFGPGAFDGSAATSPSGHIRFSPRSKKALELALREAIAMRSTDIRSGHLLLGLIREGEGLGALVLSQAQIDLRSLADEIRTEMRTNPN